MGLEWSRPPPDCGSNDEDNQFQMVTSIHYLHFAALSFGICCVIVVVISLVTKPRDPEKVTSLTLDYIEHTLLHDQNKRLISYKTFKCKCSFSCTLHMVSLYMGGL